MATSGGSTNSRLLVCSCGAISYSDNTSHDNTGCSKNNQGAHHYQPYLEGSSSNLLMIKTTKPTATGIELASDEKKEEKKQEKQEKPPKPEKPKKPNDNKTVPKLNKADKYFSIMLVMYMIIGILAFMIIETWSFVDSTYFRIVSLFNVGFGDIIPATNSGKVLNAIFMVIDMAIFVYIYWRIFYFLFIDNNNKYLNNKYYVISCVGGILLLFLCGTLVFCIGEGHGALDAFVWNFVTISSVGYGHITPSSVSAKIFCIFYILFGYLMSLYLTVYAFYTLKVKYFDQKPKVLHEPKGSDERIERTGLLNV